MGTDPNIWEKIINAVKGRLAFFVLVMLILQGVLFLIVPKLEGHNLTLLLIGCLLLMIITILIVAFKVAEKTEVSHLTLKAHERPEVPLPVKPTIDRVPPTKYDVFISSPMAALSDKQFQVDRKNISQVIACLRNNCGKPAIFWASESIQSSEEFDPPSISVETDIEAIETSEYFILIYYRKSPSSVLFEAGIALALGKKCLYFVRNRNDLPFLMRNVSEVFSNVKIYEFSKSNDINRFLTDNDVLNGTFKGWNGYAAQPAAPPDRQQRRFF